MGFCGGPSVMSTLLYKNIKVSKSIVKIASFVFARWAVIFEGKKK